MTIINPKNIAGVTSITTPSGSDNLFTVHTNDTTERFRIDSTGTASFGGDVSIGGTVSVGGTITYEDVTNVDSVGLITARNGLEIGARPGVAASISVDGNMIVSGISTFGGAINGNLTGNVTGTLQTAAQANITSVGTLTGLTVSADSTINGVSVGKGANSGSENTAVGANALDAATTSPNSAFGYNALTDNTTGQYNTAIGREALANLSLIHI